jgi:hypothetical protein
MSVASGEGNDQNYIKVRLSVCVTIGSIKTVSNTQEFKIYILFLGKNLHNGH